MRCYAQNFWRVLGGSVDPEVDNVGKEQFDHSSPITKSKLAYTSNFYYFGKSLKTPPDEYPSPSLEPSTPKVTHCHCIYARYISLSSIHSVCIMLFILFPLIRWSYLYIYTLRPLNLPTDNHFTSFNDVASILFFPQP